MVIVYSLEIGQKKQPPTLIICSLELKQVLNSCAALNNEAVINNDNIVGTVCN